MIMFDHRHELTLTILDNRHKLKLTTQYIPLDTYWTPHLIPDSARRRELRNCRRLAAFKRPSASRAAPPFWAQQAQAPTQDSVLPVLDQHLLEDLDDLGVAIDEGEDLQSFVLGE